MFKATQRSLKMGIEGKGGYINLYVFVGDLICILIHEKLIKVRHTMGQLSSKLEITWKCK